MGQIDRWFDRADWVNPICGAGKSALSGFGLTPATVLATLQGGIPIGWIRPGDMVLTRDHGYAPVEWVGPIGNAATVSIGRAGNSDTAEVGIRQPVLLQSASFASQNEHTELLIAAGHHPAIDKSHAESQRQQLFSLALQQLDLILADGLWIETLAYRVPCLCGVFHPGQGDVRSRRLWIGAELSCATVAGAA
jgi:hypothetical protein